MFQSFFSSLVRSSLSTRPPTSKTSSPFSNPLVTVPNAPITIGKIVTGIFQIFFNSLAKWRYLSFFSHYYYYYYYYYHYYYYYYYFYLCKLFTLALIGVFFPWSLRDSKSLRVFRSFSEYSSLSLKCCSLDGLDSFWVFLISSFYFRSFWVILQARQSSLVSPSRACCTASFSFSG